MAAEQRWGGRRHLPWLPYSAAARWPGRPRVLPLCKSCALARLHHRLHGHSCMGISARLAKSACPPLPLPVLSGSIPEQWSQAGAFPRLTLLGIGQNRLGGTLPHDMNMPALLIL